MATSAIQNVFTVEYDPYDPVWDNHDFSFRDEGQFQSVMASILALNGWTVDREVSVSNRGKIDILATRNRQTSLIECKMHDKDMKQALKQLAGYSEGFFQHASLYFACPNRISAHARRAYYDFLKNGIDYTDDDILRGVRPGSKNARPHRSVEVSIFPMQIILKILAAKYTELERVHGVKFSQHQLEDKAIAFYDGRTNTDLDYLRNNL